jgi:hypothetical protein
MFKDGLENNMADIEIDEIESNADEEEIEELSSDDSIQTITAHEGKNNIRIKI